VLQDLNQRKTHFNQLDGLRCIAVVAVLISHWVKYWAVVVIPLGSMGVNLFFVLSGFLITRILLLSKDEENVSTFKSIKKFYIRRTLRIFPIYFLTIFLIILLNIKGVRENMFWLLTYTQNIKFAMPGVWESGQMRYFVHLWSLSVEEQFYVFFPLLIFLIPKPKIKLFFYIVISTGVLSRLLLYIISAPKNSLYVFTPCCFDSFGIGSLLAYLLMYELETLTRILNKNYFFLIAVIIFTIDIIYSRLYIEGYGECRTVLERFLFSVCCFWIVGKAAINSYTGFMRHFLENKFVIYIGKISYGMYVYHLFIYPFFEHYIWTIYTKYSAPILGSYIWRVILKYSPPNYGNMMYQTCFLFIVTIFIASVSWYLIERPLNRLKEKIKY